MICRLDKRSKLLHLRTGTHTENLYCDAKLLRLPCTHWMAIIIVYCHSSKLTEGASANAHNRGSIFYSVSVWVCERVIYVLRERTTILYDACWLLVDVDGLSHMYKAHSYFVSTQFYPLMHCTTAAVKWGSFLVKETSLIYQSAYSNILFI